MRRCFVLLLVLLLPLKSATAVAVAIAGPPDHHAPAAAAPHSRMSQAHESDNETSHAAHGQHASQSGFAHAGCPMFGDDGVTPASADGAMSHDHPCPHLGMASMPVAAIVAPALQVPHERTACAPRRFASITLDVPSPPPTSLLALRRGG